MKRRGFTLLELLVALGLSLILIGAISTSFQLALDYSRTTPARLNKFQDEVQLRRTLAQLISGAYVSSDTADNLTYLATQSSGGEAGTPDTLVFTTLGQPVAGGFLLSDSPDTEELNSRFGPQGGTSEVSLSTVPVGEPNQTDASGLFLRIQTPSDGDPTQGGTERLLVSGVTSVTFEFWDGGSWVDTWDTVNSGSRRLPAAIRMTLEFSEGDPQTMTFRVPGSDVTAANPITITGGGAPTGP
ncbi:MAG: type II secretion system protein GspJ [Armatimonadetes bacterium]|nr:type II secretion system protein GspJ [Armatimonadota bacterium]MBS1711773.1 type II secretion system protein GspJ [Armatimonadota bacterium]MBX3109673.1 type II secretion system protein GspJ [Fimbriimonadaceae bacterium]